MAVGWLVAYATPTLANGSAIEVFRQQQGPYEVGVGVIPSTPVVGNLHLTIWVLEAASKQPITEAAVTMEAQGPEAGIAGPVTALLTIAQYYDVNIPVGTIGEWQFQVTVESPLGTERVTFPLYVRKATVTWGPVIALLASVLLAVPVVAAGSRRLRGRQRTRPKRSHS